MSTVTDLDRQSNEDSLSPRSRMLVLVVAFAALVFDGVELGLMPVASLSVSQSLLGDDYTPTLGGDWFARFTASLMLGAAIGGIALGSLGDRIGRSRAMGISILFYSVFAAMGAWAQAQEQMLVLRFLVGLGVGGLWPNGIALVAECWPGAKRPLVSGAMMAGLNTGILLLSQLARVLAYRVREQGVAKALPKNVVETLNHENPRLRFAAVEAVVQARQQNLVSALLNVLAKETDRAIYYAAWQGLRELQSSDDLQKLLEDPRGSVRKGVLLALLESNALKQDRLETLAKDSDAGTREIASLRLNHATGISGGKRPEPTRLSAANKPPQIDSPTGAALVRNLKARSGVPYKVVPGGFAVKTPVYVDRGFRLSSVPSELEGADLIQTANNDDNSRGDQWLS